VAERRPTFSEDMANDPRVVMTNIRNAGFRSYISIPLNTDTKVFGVLSVVARARHSPDDQELAFLQAIGRQVGLAVQRAQLYEQATRRLNQLSALNEVAQGITSPLEMTEVLQTVYEQVVRLTNNRDFYIALYDEAADEVDFAFYYEQGRLLPRERRRHGRGLTEYVIHTRQPLLVKNRVRDFIVNAGIQPLGAESLSWMGVPLIKNEKVIGVMVIQNYERANAYDEEDFELFKTLAGQVAVTLDNARLYESTRRSLQEAAALFEFSQQTSQTTDRWLIARAGAAACQQVLPLYKTVIYAYEGEPPQLLPLSVVEGGEVVPPDAEIAEVWKRGAEALSGVVGWVLRSGQALRIGDVRENTLFFGGADIRSELCVPISLPDRVIGAIDIESVELNAHDERDERFVATLAGHLAVALENARLIEQERQRAVELRGLHEISQALGTIGDPQATYAEVTRRLAQILNAAAAITFLYDRSRNLLRPQFPAYGVPDELFRNLDYPLDDAARALWDPYQQPAWVVNDVSKIPGVPDEYRAFIGALDVHNFMGAAMFGRGELIGVTFVGNRLSPEPFSQRDGHLLALFARQAALVIENARLVEEERLSRQHMAIIADIGRRAATTLELKALLRDVVEYICHELRYHTAMVFFAEGDTLILQAVAGGFAASGPPDYRQSTSQGVMGWVALNRKPRRVNRISEDPQFIDPAGVGVQSEVAVPLIARGEVIGVLDVESDKPDQFAESDVVLLSTIGDQVAQAIANSRSYEAEQRRASQLTIIARVGREITSLLDLHELLDRAVRLISDGFGYETVHIFTADHERGVARLVAASNHPHDDPPDSELTLRIGEQGLIGKAIGERRAILENNVPQNPDYYSTPQLTGVQSEMVVPIRLGNQVIGALDAQDKRLNAFGEDDLFIMQTLADQLAVAVANAELHMAAEQRARTDSLTGVYNHGHFLEELHKAIESSRAGSASLSLIMFDIDHFKLYNDRYGHVMGDRVLTAAVQSIHQNIKHGDLIGRWGGEEFGIALLCANSEAALLVAERIRRTLANFPLVDREGRSIEKPTASQGIAVFPDHADSFEQLVDLADRMLYRAKGKGRDRVVLFQPEGRDGQL
ncbi:MAG: GAF domain-containing protein, partial [Chloroflexi bacterium]|nr:GAF domain-containing protein [Chloroflexota bacterium]